MGLQEEITEEFLKFEYLFMKDCLQDLKNLYNEFMNVLENALHNQLALNTLSVQALHSALKDLKRMAKNKHLLLVSPRIDEIFNAPLSFMRTGSGIPVFLTVSQFEEKDSYQLYEFNSAPFYIKNNSMISIQPYHNLLAIRGEDTILTFKTFKTEELQNCLKVHNGFVCKESVIFKKDYPSCIKEVFFSTSLDKLLHNCNRYIFTVKEQIIPISPKQIYHSLP